MSEATPHRMLMQVSVLYAGKQKTLWLNPLHIIEIGETMPSRSTHAAEPTWLSVVGREGELYCAERIEVVTARWEVAMKAMMNEAGQSIGFATGHAISHFAAKDLLR